MTLKEKFMRFMYGRYGVDTLGKYSLGAGLATMVLSIVFDKMCIRDSHLKLMRLFNIINSTVWFNTLYTPRICMAEDNFYQICLVTRIPYRFFETAPLSLIHILSGIWLQE